MRGNKLKSTPDAHILAEPIALCQSLQPPDGCVNIGLHLDVLGQPLHFRIAVTDCQVSLADIVPLARVLSTKITHTAIQHVRHNQGNVPCRKKCDACCHYLVPLSIPEALKFREEFVSRPQYQRSQILRSCLAAAQQICSHRLPEPFPTPQV